MVQAHLQNYLQYISTTSYSSVPGNTPGALSSNFQSYSQKFHLLCSAKRDPKAKATRTDVVVNALKMRKLRMKAGIRLRRRSLISGS